MSHIIFIIFRTWRKMNNKFSYVIIYISTLLWFLLFQPDTFCLDKPEMHIAPVNPLFKEYQNTIMQNNRKRTQRETNFLGLIPDPVMLEIHTANSNEGQEIAEIAMFDLRDPNNDGNNDDTQMTNVQNQLSCGACWTFASYGTLEHHLKKNFSLTDAVNNFSENHMRHNHGFDIGPCAGGNMKMSAAYLFSQKGPILELNDPYDLSPDATYCKTCSPQRYIDSATFMPVRSNIYDNLYIKKAIYEKGALYSSIFFNEHDNYHPESSSYYYNDPNDSFNDSNHAIVIVGWNDNKEIESAPEKGAFIVRNSFGSHWGDNGYFYVSYYDESIAFTKLGYFLDIDENHFQFDTLYQYDELGWTGAIGAGDGNDWAANVFTADENISITGIGFYTTSSNTSYTINIYTNITSNHGYNHFSVPQLEIPISGFCKYSGFYIAQLNNPVIITQGNQFAVVIQYVSPGNAHPVPLELPVEGYSSGASALDGQSFVSDYGNLYFDIQFFSPGSNVCIKAYANPLADKPPTAISKNIHIDEDTETPILLSGIDIYGRTLSYLVMSYPLNGILSGTTPDLTYLPDQNYHGTDSFTYMVSNGIDSSEAATITIHIHPINDPPKANFTDIVINEDEIFELSSIGSDPDGDFVYCYINSPPQHGSISQTFPNRYYTPDLNYYGQDHFYFYLSDGKISTQNMLLTVTINAVNDPPTAKSFNITINEDTQKIIILQGNDIENTPLFFSIVSHPKHGGLAGELPNMIYSPQINFIGTDSFSYKANDGLLDSELAFCYITVRPMNDQPSADDIHIRTQENHAISITLTGNDMDNDPLEYFLVNSPSFGKITGDLPQIMYSPNPYYYGNDSFSYNVHDGKSYSEPATVNITIHHENAAPVVINQTHVLYENNPLSFTLTASDTDKDPITFSIVNHPKHGTVKGTLPFIIYTPMANYTGIDSFVYTAYDGIDYALPAKISLLIMDYNYAPTVQPVHFSTLKNMPVTIQLKGNDPDGDILTFNIVKSPSHGNITGASPEFIYHPQDSFTGTDTLSYQANDQAKKSNIARITINIIDFDNTAPEAISQTIVTQKNRSTHFSLVGKDSPDIPLTCSIINPPSHGILSEDFPFVTYSPDSNYTGLDHFTFKLKNGSNISNIARINLIITAFTVIQDTVDIDYSTSTIFSENFEAMTSSWKYGTAGQTNKWYVGTAVSYSGTKAAYISQDGGTTATYDQNNASESWLENTVDLTGYIDATISFYWKGWGEEYIGWDDYGEFYVNNGSDVLISESEEFVEQASWIQKSLDISAYAGSTVDIKFKWVNDGTLKDNDPAFCVDNISITGTTIQPGPGNALDFDGDDDYVLLSDGQVSAASLAMPDTITVEAWVKVDSFTDWAGIVAFINDEGIYEGGWSLGVMSGNKFYFAITTYELTLDYIFYLQSDSLYLTDTWYHLAGTYDGNKMILYINGLEVASYEPDPGGNIYYRDTYYTIGAYKDGLGTYEFDGQIDEVRVWNKARSVEDIRSSMCKKLIPDDETHLLDYYHFDHSMGTFADDYKGGNNNGVLTNMHNNDWVISGAAIGDISIYDYTGTTASDFVVTLSHSDGDTMTAAGESGHYSGIHLFLVNEPPSFTTPPTGWDIIHTGHYWGVFPVGSDPTYDVLYHYDGLTGISEEMNLKLASRSTSKNQWAESGNVHLDMNLDTIQKNGSSRIEYIPGESSNPIISDIDDQSIPYVTVSFSIKDSDGGPIILQATSSNQSILPHTDINIAGCGSNSYTVNTAAGIEKSLTLTVMPSINAHGKIFIQLLATDSQNLTTINSFAMIISPPGSGNSLDFDGTNQYVNLGSNIDLSYKSFTIEFWAKRTSHTPEYRCVIGQGAALVDKRIF
ncbi:MAG: hypothetical protein OMM_01208 [Candidatus Magnetoglobus multicellularis str. Araruama]|uniref:Uncharacterized protein n=1 Tax=Candidatus Magnetoglobus multicellularis str. Araruama TaxID=890399 RepID=A0A1V1PDZ7_9BACT|nr:MAG: hypothetical protein OMM_01208 [Candidatus Magnetoglobus multicellularis str. Araruama]